MIRSRYRNVLVALVAVLALGVVGVASASAALPEFVPSEGAKFPITFQDAAQKTESFFETTLGTTETPRCTGSQVKGEITGAKVASVTLEFTGCYTTGLHQVWTGEEGKPGTVVLPGTGTLVYINKAEKKVAVLDTLKKTYLFISEGWEAEVWGRIVIPVTPLNTSTTKFALPIHKKASCLGCQEYRSYENEKGEEVKFVHPFYEFSHGGQHEAALEMNGTNEVTASKALTVKG